MEHHALLAMFERYMNAWRRGDAGTCISIYAQDAQMDDPLLPEPLRGIDQLESYFVRGFTERPADTTREILNVATSEDCLFFEWRISSSAGGSKGISVWDVENDSVVRDRSYWFETN